MSRGELACKVYVGDLTPDATEKEIEREFSYYGKLKSVWVARNPSGFAFVEFEDSRDADDAIAGLDGKTICGSRVRVEPSSGKKKPKPWEREGRGGSGGYGGGGGGYGGGGYGSRGRGPPRYDSRRPAGGKPFDPNDECYKCGERGHYAYDCNGGGGGGRSRGGRSRSRSRDRYRRSRSRSRGRRSRSDSRGRY